MLICNCSLAGSEACKTCAAYINEYGYTTAHNVYIWTESEKVEVPPSIVPDPWKHRSEGMKCATCMWYVRKEAEEGSIIIGRCRRHAPTMNGYPVVYETDWCGDHKLDEKKVK